jgi:GT2 family glycosyltransferase
MTQSAYESAAATGLSVVITTCQRPVVSARLARAIASQLSPADELLIVDDARRDGVPFRVAEAGLTECDQVKAIRTYGSGVAVARNRALAEAGRDWIVFLDDDTVPAPSFLSMVRGYVSEPGCDVLTGNVLSHPDSGDTGRLFDERYSLSRGPVSHTFRGRTGTVWSPNDVWRVGVGACMTWRTAELRKLGGFCSELGQGRRFGGSEDLEAFRRALLAGLTIRYEAGLVVQHYAPASRAELAAKMKGYTFALGALAAEVWLSEGRPGMAAHVLRDALVSPWRAAQELARRAVGLTYLPVLPSLLFPVQAAYAFTGYIRRRRAQPGGPGDSGGK